MMNQLTVYRQSDVAILILMEDNSQAVAPISAVHIVAIIALL